MSEALHCWRCGVLLELAPPLGRSEECGACRAQLHVCRMCVHFARELPKQCAEADAEEVRDKERANFCDWFRASSDAYTGEFSGPEARARAELAALFGQPENPSAGRSLPENNSAAEALFRARDGKK